MSLADDERAQSVQIGAILLLGTLVISLSVYQVTSVPQQNGAVEFDHNQQVQSQLQAVRNAILETAATGEGRSASVSLGTQYSNRVFAVNPSPPSGTLETAALGNLTIANAVPAGEGGTVTETSDFWDEDGDGEGESKQYASTALIYEPNYNEYREAPRTVYEHTALANKFGGADGANRTDLLLSNQTLIDGRDITLVTLDGSLSEAGSGTVSIDTRPISVSNTVVPIRSAAGENLTLTLPTTLSEWRWNDLLADAEFASIENYTSGTSRSEVVIQLKEEGEPYRLRMAKIGVGSGAPSTSAAYLTAVPGSTGPVAENDTRELRVEVRDRYNNPIGGETVNLTIMPTGGNQSGNLSTSDQLAKAVTVTTDEQGRASATYRARTNIDGGPIPVIIGANRTNEIGPTESLALDSPNTVKFDFNVTNTDESPASYSIDFGPNQTAIANQSGVTCESAGCTYNGSTGTIDLSIPTSPTTPDVPFSVGTDNQSVAIAEARADRTGPNGTAAVEIDVRGPGTTNLTVSSGTSTKIISLTIRNQDPAASFEFLPTNPETRQQVEFDARDSNDPNGDRLTYEWDFGDGNTSTTAAPTTDHVYGDDGTYDATLTVVDEHGGRNATTETIGVSNRPPAAEIDPNPLVPKTDETVVFDGTDSSDSDGSITSYEWDFGDGATETGATPSHSYGEDGTYTVNLTVTDDNGATRTTSRDVTVRNRAPTADFDFGPANPQSGDDITFDASGSSDPDGEIVRYEWNLTDDSGQSFTTSGETVTAGSLDGGTYVMNLTVTDDDGATHSTSETFLVEEDNSPVVENFDARSDNIGQITVNWAVSDPNGDLQSVEIVVSNDDYSSKTFGISGSSASGSTTFNLLSSGTYDVAITVTDKAGNTDTRSTTVTVSLAGSAPRLGAPLFPSLPGIRLPEATTSARFVS